MDSRRSFLLGLAWTGLVRSTFAATDRPDPGPVVAGYGALAFESYGACHAAATRLLESVRSFTAAPAEPALALCRTAWITARHWYGQTEAFRFYGGPIDGRDGPEGRMNAWPVDAAYIDAVIGRPDAGIINDRSVALSRQVLAALNESGGEANISTGWHAIEFLLWGQDVDPDGPGRRPASDFLDGGARNADRRRLYLQLATELLADDLQGLRDAWSPGQHNYRAAFAADTACIAKMFTGLGTLARAELAGERLEVALDTLQQEDEQSCFSDNTHNDFIAGVLGIRNVWGGGFLRPDGSMLRVAALRDWVAEQAPGPAAAVDADLAAAETCARALRAPFDREILGANDAPGRVRAFVLLHSLRESAEALAAAASAVDARHAQPLAAAGGGSP